MFSPFTGLLFDPDRVAPTSGDATSPPYDVIDAEERVRLLERSPYNVVRLLLAARGDKRYQQAAALLSSWRQTELLRPDPGPRYYLYEMDYRRPDDSLVTARGVVGALHVEPLGIRILPHEETMAKHRADRTAVLTATEANLDLIVALSASPDLGDLLAPTGAPRLDFTVEEVRHRLTDITDLERIEAISSAVAGHAVSIADGHHRYTTALAYREMREAKGEIGSWDGIMAMVAPAEGSGLRVAPYHRLFASGVLDESALTDSFEVLPTEPAEPTEPGTLVTVSRERSLFLRPRADRLASLPGPWREAGAAVAREILYPALGLAEDAAEYTPDWERAVAAAQSGGGIAVLTAPVSEHAIADASDAGLRFPQKTTFFTPKPRAGLVARVFDTP
jgi:uncharacterized protein (DUF1015 family)